MPTPCSAYEFRSNYFFIISFDGPLFSAIYPASSFSVSLKSHRLSELTASAVAEDPPLPASSTAQSGCGAHQANRLVSPFPNRHLYHVSDFHPRFPHLHLPLRNAPGQSSYSPHHRSVRNAKTKTFRVRAWDLASRCGLPKRSAAGPSATRKAWFPFFRVSRYTTLTVNASTLSNTVNSGHTLREF